MNLLYSMQEYSPSYGANKTTNLSNIFVADLQYKFTPSFSTRMELQYLTTKEDQKDWMAALLEINFARLDDTMGVKGAGRSGIYSD